jgi:WD40 repeat protein
LVVGHSRQRKTTNKGAVFMSEFSRNLAFIIGINNYTNGISPLQNAVNDAKKLVEILREKHEYKVWVCLDEVATLNNLNQLLEETLLEQVNENDRLLFYFAGHGIALNGDDGPAGYLIPQGAKLGDVQTYLPMAKLEECLNKLPCHHFLGILDCCFAGAFRWSSNRDLLTAPEVIHKERYDRFITDPAWQVITSAASDQKALDAFALNAERRQIGNHSPFAAALIEALAGKADVYPPASNGKPSGDGVITATELYLYLRDAVEPATEGNRQRQTPGIHPLKKHDKGEYIFLSPGHPLNLPPAPPLDASKNPYRGLKSFEEKHSELFFGRIELVEKLQNFVKSHPLTVVLGASGSGKSSLVKAGLIPQLRQDNTEKWEILEPIRPGETPLQGLNNALKNAQLPEVAAQNPQQNLAMSIDAWAKRNSNSKLLLFIDQSEEVITLCQNEDERKEFFQQILKAINVHRDRLRVVLSLRSDFEPQIRDAGLKFVPTNYNAGNTELKSRWHSGRFIVPAMTRADLREAIEKPAETRVMYFQPHELVEQLIDEVADMPGALPLLSFALSELYLKYLKRQRDAENRSITIDRALTQADYQDLGGVIQSLTQKADEEYEMLVKEDLAYKQIIRHVMLRMVALGGGELARRRVPLSELEYPPPKHDLVKEVIERFTKARLLVTGEDAEGNNYVEPAHDALVRGWQKLLTWVKEEKNLRLQRRLTPSALEWNNQSQVKFLWNTNPYLHVLDQEILKSPDNNWLNQVEANFVRESIKLRRKKSITRWSLISAAFVLLGSATGIAINFAIDAQNRFLEASSTSAESMFNSGRELDALVKATETGESLKNTLPFIVNEKNRIQVINILRKIVYGIKEKNHFITNDKNIINVSYSPVSNILASINKSGTIKLWQDDGKIIQEFSQNQVNDDGEYFSIRFSSDGKKLIAASDKQGIKIWQRQSHNKFTQHQIISQKETIMSIAISRDFKKIAIGSFLGNKNLIKIFTIDGKLLKTFDNAHNKRINDLSFSPDGQTLASGSADDTVKIWDLQNAKDIKTILINKAVFIVTFLNKDTLITADSDEKIKLWDVYKGNLKKEFKERHLQTISDLAVSSDHKTLVSASKDKTIKIWNIEDGKLLDTLTNDTSGFLDVEFIKNSKEIASVSENGDIKMWDLDNKLPTLEGEKLSFSPDKSTIATIKNREIKLWKPNFQPIKSFLTDHNGSITQIRFSHDSKIIASTSADKTIKLWNLNGKLLTTLKGHQESVTSVAFNPKDNIIVSGSLDRTAKLWSINGTLKKTLKGHQEVVTSVDFSRDGEIIASGSNDDKVKLWNQKGELMNTLQDYTDDILDVKFITVTAFLQGFWEKQFVATASRDKTVQLRSLNGKKLGNSLEHKDGVKQLKFDPNNNILASFTENNTIKFWSLKGNDLLTINSDDNISDIDFSPDGKMFAYATRDEKVYFLGLDLADLLEHSCKWLHNYLNTGQDYNQNSQVKLCWK